MISRVPECTSSKSPCVRGSCYSARPLFLDYEVSNPDHIDHYDFDLPAELIAQTPAVQRRDSRLLLIDPRTQSLIDSQFAQLPQQVRAGDLLVFNDTRVIPARLFGRRPSGGKVELLLERLLDESQALMQLRASKKPKPDELLQIEGDAQLRVIGRLDSFFVVESVLESMQSLLDRVGHVPLPPYIERVDADADQERYQTVYARERGAVAAPTAGLHFDQRMLDQLQAAGVESGYLTLHVGAGTFQNLRGDTVDEITLHAERYKISAQLAAQIATAKAAGRRVVAVGTTSLRALESAAAESGTVSPSAGETSLFIYPGGPPIRVVDALLTNFHLPKSSLLMLVSAFAGTDFVLSAYEHAVAQRYRFFSYGDVMFIPSKARPST